MISKKKERIKDIVVSDSMVVVMYGEQQIIDEEQQAQQQQQQLIAHPQQDSATNNLNNISALSSSVSNGGINSANNGAFRRKTMLEIPRDAPKLYLFDSNNDYVMGADAKIHDKHALFHLPKSPMFCLTSENGEEMRVITREGKRVHILSLAKGFQIHTSLRHFVQGKYNSSEWSLVNPESGRVVPLNELGSFTRVFVIEDQVTGHFKGLFAVSKENKSMSYFEQVEQKVMPQVGEYDPIIGEANVVADIDPSSVGVHLQIPLITI